MIIFKKLKWSNLFSYGPDNEITFTDSPVTQLVGINGAGKTSIPLILQEVTHCKNTKKIIKANLKNRNVTGNISAELYFEKDDVEYVIKMQRTSSKLSVILLQDDEDISSHTAPATMKTIEGILNLDFDTFSQLIYQSTKNNLQFLTATDTQRKKFLITLFNLEKYIEVFETLKGILAEINKDIAEIQGRYSVYENWIKEHEKADLTRKELFNVPDVDEEEIKNVGALTAKKNEASSTNKKINSNNAYKSELQSIDSSLLTASLTEEAGIRELETDLTEIRILKNEKVKLLKTSEGKKPFCQVCKQPIDIADSIKLAEDCRIEIDKFEKNSTLITTQLKKLKENRAENQKITEGVENFEKLSNLIDYDLDSDVINVDELDEEIRIMHNSIKVLRNSITYITGENEKIIEHNSTAEIKKKQLGEYQGKLLIELNNLEELFNTITQLDILKDAFSTNGLVSYKLEYLVKDLEVVINEYLEELSRGRFQINFILKGDKLNIEVVDNGKVITINEVSEGELNKINVATLLAIRKLMQQLSNTKLNLLFLDEIMGVLDSFGREDLIKVLLQEDSLNTFLVTHEYTHPLVPALNIVQTNNISRIE